MRNILILGAGKSSISLIDYLAEHAGEQQWQVTVADVSAELALQKTKGRPNTKAIAFDFKKEDKRRLLIGKSDLVISMLPATMHITLAEDCLALKKNLITPSYISAAMQAMNDKVAKSKLIFMNEIGLDPGIDHMSAMQIIDKLKAEGKVITGFKSHCGGLVAPESDDNRWHYKFTWNPRNVILAGQGEGGIHYLQSGKKRNLSYGQLFAAAEVLKIKGYGKFESYPNRDSLKYIDEYGLSGVKTMYRGTLRRPPYCQGWNTLIQLGFTNPEERPTEDFKQEVVGLINNAGIIATNKIRKLINDTGVLPLLLKSKSKSITPADVLQKALEGKWRMRAKDKDMIVMVHEVEYLAGKKKEHLQSSLVYIGKNGEHTAMAATVGLPVGIAAKMILNGEIKRRGVLMPKYPEIYNPILTELENHGIKFRERSNTKA